LTRTDEQTPRLLAETSVPTAARMRLLGRRLATLLRPGDLIVLNGPLGAGKTTLVQGIGDGLGVRGPVTSPTFVIARIHPALRGGPALVHADAYRLGSPAEVDDLDLDADLDRSVTVVEWGRGLVEGLTPSWLDVTIGWPAPGAAAARPVTAAGQPTTGWPGPGAEPGIRRGSGPAGGSGPADGSGPAAGSGPADEPRVVRLTGRGRRWATAAESVHLAISGAAEVL
jgi:tRNA threonylcarbamoyladenosine biosynthesis protein TsaE